MSPAISRGRGGVWTPYELLAAREEGSRPFVTGYDGPDQCTELSVTTALNAIAKAAGLLRDELGLAPGERLSVDLPVHWQLPVWTLAGLTAGLEVGRRVSERVEARIVGPDGLAELAGGAEPRADEILGCSCDVFGMPVRGGVPPGVLDVGLAVRAHPDVYQGEPGAVARAGLLQPVEHRSSTGTDGAVDLVTWSDLVARGPVDPPRARTWVSEEALAGAGLPSGALLRRAAVDPVLCDGSVVLARGLSLADAERLRSEQGALLRTSPGAATDDA